MTILRSWPAEFIGGCRNRPVRSDARLDEAAIRRWACRSGGRIISFRLFGLYSAVATVRSHILIHCRLRHPRMGLAVQPHSFLGWQRLSAGTGEACAEGGAASKACAFELF